MGSQLLCLAVLALRSAGLPSEADVGVEVKDYIDPFDEVCANCNERSGQHYFAEVGNSYCPPSPQKIQRFKPTGKYKNRRGVKLKSPKRKALLLVLK